MSWLVRLDRPNGRFFLGVEMRNRLQLGRTDDGCLSLAPQSAIPLATIIKLATGTATSEIHEHSLVITHEENRGGRASGQIRSPWGEGRFLELSSECRVIAHPSTSPEVRLRALMRLSDSPRISVSFAGLRHFCRLPLGLPVSIGRHHLCGIAIDLDGLASEHCEVFWRGGDAIAIRALDGAVSVNGVVCRDAWVQPGDSIRLAPLRIPLTLDFPRGSPYAACHAVVSDSALCADHP